MESLNSSEEEDENLDRYFKNRVVHAPYACLAMFRMIAGVPTKLVWPADLDLDKEMKYLPLHLSRLVWDSLQGKLAISRSRVENLLKAQALVDAHIQRVLFNAWASRVWTLRRTRSIFSWLRTVYLFNEWARTAHAQRQQRRAFEVVRLSYIQRRQRPLLDLWRHTARCHRLVTDFQALQHKKQKQSSLKRLRHVAQTHASVRSKLAQLIVKQDSAKRLDFLWHLQQRTHRNQMAKASVHRSALHYCKVTSRSVLKVLFCFGQIQKGARELSGKAESHFEHRKVRAGLETLKLLVKRRKWSRDLLRKDLFFKEVEKRMYFTAFQCLAQRRIHRKRLHQAQNHYEYCRISRNFQSLRSWFGNQKWRRAQINLAEDHLKQKQMLESLVKLWRWFGKRKTLREQLNLAEHRLKHKEMMESIAKLRESSKYSRQLRRKLHREARMKQSKKILKTSKPLGDLNQCVHEKPGVEESPQRLEVWQKYQISRVFARLKKNVCLGHAASIFDIKMKNLGISHLKAFCSRSRKLEESYGHAIAHNQKQIHLSLIQNLNPDDEASLPLSNGEAVLVKVRKEVLQHWYAISRIEILETKLKLQATSYWRSSRVLKAVQKLNIHAKLCKATARHNLLSMTLMFESWKALWKRRQHLKALQQKVTQNHEQFVTSQRWKIWVKATTYVALLRCNSDQVVANRHCAMCLWVLLKWRRHYKFSSFSTRIEHVFWKYMFRILFLQWKAKTEERLALISACKTFVQVKNKNVKKVGLRVMLHNTVENAILQRLLILLENYNGTLAKDHFFGQWQEKTLRWKLALQRLRLWAHNDRFKSVKDSFQIWKHSTETICKIEHWFWSTCLRYDWIRRQLFFIHWAREAFGAKCLSVVLGEAEWRCTILRAKRGFGRLYDNTVKFAQQQRKGRLLQHSIASASLTLSFKLGMSSLKKHSKEYGAAVSIQRDYRRFSARCSLLAIKKDLQEKEHSADIFYKHTTKKHFFNDWLHGINIQRHQTTLVEKSKIWNAWKDTHREIRNTFRALKKMTQCFNRLHLSGAFEELCEHSHLYRAMELVMALHHITSTRRIFGLWQHGIARWERARQFGEGLLVALDRGLVRACWACWMLYTRHRGQKKALQHAAAVMHTSFHSSCALTLWKEYTMTQSFLRILDQRARYQYQKRLGKIFFTNISAFVARRKKQKQSIGAGIYQSHRQSSLHSIGRWKIWMYFLAHERNCYRQATGFQKTATSLRHFIRWRYQSTQSSWSRSIEAAANTWCVGRKARLALSCWYQSCHNEQILRTNNLKAFVFAWASVVERPFAAWKWYTRNQNKQRRRIVKFHCLVTLPRALKEWEEFTLTKMVDRRNSRIALKHCYHRWLLQGLVRLRQHKHTTVSKQYQLLKATKHFFLTARHRGLSNLVMFLVFTRKKRRRRKRLMRSRAQNLLLSVFLPWVMYIRYKKKVMKFYRKRALKRFIRKWKARIKLKANAQAVRAALHLRQNYKLQCSIFHQWAIGIHRQKRLRLSYRAVAGLRAGKVLQDCWKWWRVLKVENNGVGSRGFALSVAHTKREMARAFRGWIRAYHVSHSRKVTTKRLVFDAWIQFCHDKNLWVARTVQHESDWKIQTGRFGFARWRENHRTIVHNKNLVEAASSYHSSLLTFRGFEHWKRWQNKRDFEKGQWLFGMVNWSFKRWFANVKRRRMCVKKRCLLSWRKFVIIRRRRGEVLRKAVNGIFGNIHVTRCMEAWKGYAHRSQLIKLKMKRAVAKQKYFFFDRWKTLRNISLSLKENSSIVERRQHYKMKQKALKFWRKLCHAEQYILDFRGQGRWGHRLMSEWFDRWVFLVRLEGQERYAAEYNLYRLQRAVFRAWYRQVSRALNLQKEIIARGYKRKTTTRISRIKEELYRKAVKYDSDGDY